MTKKDIRIHTGEKPYKTFICRLYNIVLVKKRSDQRSVNDAYTDSYGGKLAKISQNVSTL